MQCLQNLVIVTLQNSKVFGPILSTFEVNNIIRVDSIPKMLRLSKKNRTRQRKFKKKIQKIFFNPLQMSEKESKNYN